MSKERVVIIGANAFQNKLIERAKEKGYETHVFAWECGDIGEKTADYFYPISITEKEEILTKCKEINPIGICSIASDLAVGTVNYVANELNLIANCNECSSIAMNKFAMRRTFEQYNLPIPKFCLYKEESDKEKVLEASLNFPLIVKPTDRSGSRGVSQINNIEELGDAVEVAMKESFSNTAIIEEYVGGIEYSIEYISYEGKHYFLSATRKYTTGYPHFVEIAHYQPANLEEDTLNKVKKIVEKALDSLKISYGASHSEIKIDKENEVKIIEIGARMGGGCIGSDLVKISTGHDFVDMVLDISCGKKLMLTKIQEPKIAFIKFFITEEDWVLCKDIEEKHPEWIYEINGTCPQNNSKNPSSSEDRNGYYILKLDSINELNEVIGRALPNE